MATAEAPALVEERAELVEFRRQDAAIAKLKAEYGELRINGIDDAEGFKIVHAARMNVRAVRVGLEKTRVALKADALAYGRTVDAEAKRLFALIEPLEKHLDAEESVVTEAKAKAAREAAAAKQAALQKRYDALAAVGVFVAPALLESIDDTEFNRRLGVATAEHEAKVKAEAEAAEKRKAEEAALAAERAKLDEARQAQEAEAARLRAEQEKIDAEKRAEEQRKADEARAKAQAEAIEKARVEAAEKARIETEQRIAADAAKAKADAEAAEAARLKAEDEKPQRERIIALAEHIALLPTPEGPGQIAVLNVLRKTVAELHAIANGELK